MGQTPFPFYSTGCFFFVFSSSSGWFPLSWYFLCFISAYYEGKLFASIFQTRLLRVSIIGPLSSHAIPESKPVAKGRPLNHLRHILVDRVRSDSLALHGLFGKLVHTFSKGEGSWSKWTLCRCPTQYVCYTKLYNV